MDVELSAEGPLRLLRVSDCSADLPRQLCGDRSWSVGRGMIVVDGEASRCPRHVPGLAGAHCFACGAPGSWLTLTDKSQRRGASVDNQHDDGRWADWRSTIAITGINRSALAWAISGGQVQYTLARPGHEGILMIHLEDVEALIGVTQAPRLRLVKDGG